MEDIMNDLSNTNDASPDEATPVVQNTPEKTCRSSSIGENLCQVLNKKNC
ncbi:unnamed protein product [Acanthoscelides obtectus]|uniref:Uncharacterized protein n=1 Tax=Acanthoscelides obtectus TaxID=200917 RepID=A0A9P0KBB5_ACAOB|nr:unnamed protein product [Acanthoscelides obtectus]CAK1622913.1 hypothetical protein AOBTE_LOCUS1727 [Acanthoscelides obtectus]